MAAERDIEKYLKRSVRRKGGDVRKVKWIGRNLAPDRLVMLPWREAFLAEIKHPLKGATFPNNARERGQRKEHEDLRKLGMQVYVLWSFKQIDALLAQ